MGLEPERLLRAVADGLPDSLELAKALLKAVLGESLVKRAVALDELLPKANPVALDPRGPPTF